MYLKSIMNVADHGEVTGDTITGRYADASEVLDRIDALGISYAEVRFKTKCIEHR